RGSGLTPADGLAGWFALFADFPLRPLRLKGFDLADATSSSLTAKDAKEIRRETAKTSFNC
ncbi:MAG TPA: hypothetical protein VK198_05985, partial [Terriglobales bacterium]|nr:hypothetical protein [Terriglobales bacterium]